ncbi:complex I subunit 4 family protein [Chondromyces apiculatus]|uniref:NADH-ubiquinone oxidoreductase chain M n=1 Tax=Chondromyces apiculatus DSM 436 TaxID=1192034 RepID=A0A017T1T5_9BACT|nr:proton-conducting transporter membrane subunit [Chondromyces apiculatus]EYF02947.1 NADH-ubiquinone oxidoreductase chain M [Chondromyces apiculatus DSM 436]
MSALVLLSALILVPWVTALLVRRAPSDERGSEIAIAGAAVTLLLAVAPLALMHGGSFDGVGPTLPLVGARLHLGLDGYSVVMPLLVAGMQLCLLIAGRRAVLDRPNLAAVLSTASATIAILCARDLALFGVAWVATLIPGERLIARKEVNDPLLRRTYRLFLLGGTLPIVAGIAGIAWLAAQRGAVAPFDIDEIHRVGLPAASQPVLFALLGLAVLIRRAAVPFHGWLPVLLERGPFGVALLLGQAQVGIHLLLTVVVPLLPEGSAAGMPIIAGVGLLSTVHGAVLALVQTDLRRMIGYLMSSQKGVMLLGIASMNIQSVSGALLQGVASTISLTGLAIVIWAIEARTGAADTRKLGGLVASMPRAAAFFFLLACASIGFPGALTFVSEDLLIHGVLHVHPVLAVIMLVATAINGITVFRAFQRTFLGPAPRARYAAVESMLLRERVVLLSLVALTVVLGVAPTRLLVLREGVVDRVVEQIHP